MIQVNCKSDAVKKFAPKGILCPEGVVYYNMRCDPSFVTFTYKIAVQEKSDGCKTSAQLSSVIRQLDYDTSVDDDTEDIGSCRQKLVGCRVAKTESDQTFFGTITKCSSGDDRKLHYQVHFDVDHHENNKEVTEDQLSHLRHEYSLQSSKDFVGESGGGSKLPANPSAKLPPVPPTIASMDNDDDNDEKSSSVPVSSTFTDTSTFDGGKTGSYWNSPTGNRKRIRYPTVSYNSSKNSETSTIKKLLPIVTDSNTCTIFFSKDNLQFLQMFVEALTCPSRKQVPKLVPLSNSESEDYSGYYEEKMPPLTHHLNFRKSVKTAMSSNQFIMINPNFTLFQCPIMPPKSIISDDKIGCAELLPLHALENSSITNLQAPTPDSFVKSVNFVRFTRQDFDGTKCEGWFGPSHIHFYLSWLLVSNRINKQLMKNIMILPFNIYREFEKNNKDNTNEDLASPLYDDLVKKEQRDIFDSSLVFIFIYREFCWSLAVLVNSQKKGAAAITPSPDAQKDVVQPNQAVLFYFALRPCSKNLDPDRVNNQEHADRTMEMKIKSFVRTCWNKRCSPSVDNEILPTDIGFRVETYSMIPLLFNSISSGKYNQALIFNIIFYIIYYISLCTCS